MLIWVKWRCDFWRKGIRVWFNKSKKFLIIGNQNAITYKEIFPLLKGNEMWIGYRFGDMAFKVPSDSEPRATRYWQDETGQKWRSLGNVCWYTNLDIKKRHEKLPLYKSYSPDEFPTYDNYDAIEVAKTADIPYDYDGVMGVPITFMDKYNPEQFEIVGMCENEDLYGLKTKVYGREECQKAYLAKFGKKGTYDLNASGVLVVYGLQEKVYQRILIRHRKVEGRKP